MSTPEQPASPPLTRKQMRDIRNTGSTPVIESDEGEVDAHPIFGAPQPPAPVAPPAPLPRPAAPVVVAPAPAPDATVDLGVSPLTRRQARQQERIRTASVPVITPEVIAAHNAATASAPPAPPVAETPFAPAPPPVEAEPDEAAPVESVGVDSGMHSLFGVVKDEAPEPVAPPTYEAPAAAGSAAWPIQAAPVEEAPADEAVALFDPAPQEPEQAKSVVNPLFGAGVLAQEAPVPVTANADMPPSFDQLLSRSTGSISIPNALIVSQAPEIAPLVAPVTATGEVLITGTFNLPEGLGSTGHAKGTADGKEIDATLVDGELPRHSSPTPIAASAAVSTVKMPGEVIKPPVPEKGSRLMMTLAITAGALALALVGVLILAFVTGVF